MIYDLYEDESGRQFLWKHCEIPGCPNNVCVNRSDRFCYPHSPADMTLQQMMEVGKAVPGGTACQSSEHAVPETTSNDEQQF